MSDTGAVSADHADSGWDDYSERVLRNEGRLLGLENLVAEAREADRKLIEQRSDSLARELERRAEALLELVTARADAVLALGKEERESDRREVQLIVKSLREIYDVAIKKNYEQSQDAIRALEQRRVAATEKVEQMVRSWRHSDKEARELFAKELDKHLDQLNHNNERMRDFQSHSVTRELWQSERDAAVVREGLLRDQIINLEKSLLTMTPMSQADKTHAEIIQRMETQISAASEVLDNKIGVVAEKVVDLKEYTDKRQGRSAGYSAFYGWVIAGITILIAVVVGANAIFN